MVVVKNKVCVITKIGRVGRCVVSYLKDWMMCTYNDRQVLCAGCCVVTVVARLGSVQLQRLAGLG